MNISLPAGRFSISEVCLGSSTDNEPLKMLTRQWDYYSQTQTLLHEKEMLMLQQLDIFFTFVILCSVVLSNNQKGKSRELKKNLMNFKISFNKCWLRLSSLNQKFFNMQVVTWHLFTMTKPYCMCTLTSVSLFDWFVNFLFMSLCIKITLSMKKNITLSVLINNTKNGSGGPLCTSRQMLFNSFMRIPI